MPIRKDVGSPSLRSLSCNITHCMCRCFLALFRLPCGNRFWEPAQGKQWLSGTSTDMKNKCSFHSNPGVMKLQQANLLACKYGNISNPLQFLTAFSLSHHTPWKCELSENQTLVLSCSLLYRQYLKQCLFIVDAMSVDFHTIKSILYQTICDYFYVTSKIKI